MAYRGTLKVYLGFAPGVGKTCAMLAEAHDLHQRGLNVVVGVVEDHGRDHTAQMAQGLPTIPRREVSYRGHRFSELDVEAVLAAEPQIVLVDELAHTVVAEDDPHQVEPTKKRWHDVYRLLDAGIDVISTMNIQHLESLNDVVAAVTGVRQRETVPDQVLRDADEIELVDLSPDALRIRLSRGEIYEAEQAKKAMESYFRVGNLTALRELALLWLADKVEEVLEKYRADRAIESHWPTRERIVVAVPADDSAEALIRRGARITGRVAGREMYVVHVAGNDDALRSDVPRNLERLQALTESLGGTWRVVVGDDVATSLLEFARTVNASQLVLGLGRRRSRLFGTSMSQHIIDECGPIDVHMVSTNVRQTRWRPRAQAGLSTPRKVTGWLLGVVVPLVFTWMVLSSPTTEEYLGAVLLGYLTIVVFSALAGGWWPAAASVVISTLLANWFFSDPVHTFTVTRPASVLQLFLFLAIAGAVAWVVEVAERRRTEATRSLSQAVVMSELARGVVSDGDDVSALLDRLQETFGFTRVDLQRLFQERKVWRTIATTSPEGITCPWDGGKNPQHVSAGDNLRLLVGGRELTPNEQVMISAHGARISALLDQEEMDAMRRATAALEAGNRMGTALLTAVSHDLRTPLSGIKAAVSALTYEGFELSAEDRASLLETIEQQSDRLEIVIGNLLDMSRLNSNIVAVQHRPLLLGDVVEAVRGELMDNGDYVELDPESEEVSFLGDAGLVQRIMVNTVLNARKFAPGSQVHVSAQRESDMVEILLSDDGPGIPTDQWEKIFLPFQRLGDQSSTAGLGLGLAVSRGFAEAMGGQLTVTNTPGGGATLVLLLPAEEVQRLPEPAKEGPVRAPGENRQEGEMA